VDVKSEPGVVHCKLAGKLTEDEARAFVDAHNRAIDDFGKRTYKVWVDLTELAPLSPEAAAEVELAKRYSSHRPNFLGSAVLVSSATVAMQHRRTSVSGGVMATELISDDADALRAHLRAVERQRGS
jgi:hypothetical protein